MADGRTKPISELEPGDRIYGTERRGAYRRYMVTTVLDKWSTVKRAYRVTLEDGTTLVASGDHRFLTEHGRKYVTGAMGGAGKRPYLTTRNRFRRVLDDPGRPNRVRQLRLTGGLPERLRFFHLTDPANTRKRSIEGAALKCRAALQVVSIEDLGLELPLWDITTGTGDFIANGVVSHNCFARNTHTYLDLDAGADFDQKVIVKVNAGELVRRELAAPRWRGTHIAMGTNVDCYQRAEGRHRLVRLAKNRGRGARLSPGTDRVTLGPCAPPSRSSPTPP